MPELCIICARKPCQTPQSFRLSSPEDESRQCPAAGELGLSCMYYTCRHGIGLAAWTHGTGLLMCPSFLQAGYLFRSFQGSGRYRFLRTSTRNVARGAQKASGATTIGRRALPPSRLPRPSRRPNDDVSARGTDMCADRYAPREDTLMGPAHMLADDHHAPASYWYLKEPWLLMAGLASRGRVG